MDLVLGCAQAAQRARLCTLAREAGHYVLYDCADGNELLHATMLLLPDAVLCDLILPGLDGAALAGRIQKHSLPLAPSVVVQTPKGLHAHLTGLERARTAYSQPETLAVLQTAADRPLDAKTHLAALKKLKDLGLPEHMRGGLYARQALLLCIADTRRLKNLRDLVYLPIARKNGATPASVERDIRYAIESAWRYGQMRALEENFGYTVLPERGKPTNRAFFAQLTESLRRNLRAQGRASI